MVYRSGTRSFLGQTDTAGSADVIYTYSVHLKQAVTSRISSHVEFCCLFYTVILTKDIISLASLNMI